MPGDRLRTGTTLAPQEQKTQERDIIIPVDRCLAMGAVGAREDNRLLPWQAINTDITKTTYNIAYNEEIDKYSIVQVYH